MNGFLVIGAFCIFLFFVNQWFERRRAKFYKKLREDLQELQDLFGEHAKKELDEKVDNMSSKE